ncbi:MAG TPA: TlyA family RNA methyltransferase [bacterium]|nr:TlyA family RNA methyltransferase [bacterium]
MSRINSIRLDQRLVELGLAETRTRAQALIMAGAVLVDGKVKDKPGAPVAPDAAVTLKERLKYVSRGGLKLEAALDAFGVDPSGKICLDIGASTGGFTDCLLQRGAARVYALDVGKGQLDLKLRNDPRVKVMEGLNARYLQSSDLAELVQLAVIDVSFISLELILPALALLLAPAADVIPLVKPQFEAGREQVGKGGVVRDPAVIMACVDKVSACARGLGLIEQGRVAAPIKGPKGNQEYLLHLRK